MYQVSITLLLFVLLLLPIQSVNANESHKNKKPKAPVSSTQAVVSNPQIDPSIELVEVPVFGPKDFSGGLKGTINYKESFLMNENTTEGIIYVTNLSVNDYPECLADSPGHDSRGHDSRLDQEDKRHKNKNDHNHSIQRSSSSHHGSIHLNQGPNKFICKIKNVWVDIKKYFLEPKFVEIYFNDKKVLHKKEFIRVNTEANTGEPINVVPVKLFSENQIRVKIHGSPLAKVNVVVKALVPNKIPIANFDYSPADLTAPVTVSFSGLSSIDPDGQIVSYVWDFGDGSTDQGSIVNHRYALPGNYVVTLTITDNVGAIGKISQTLQVHADITPPVLSITSPTEGEVVSGQLSVNLIGNVNEPLSLLTAQISGEAEYSIPLLADGLSFNQVLHVTSGGAKTITVKAVDIAGNISLRSINFSFLFNAVPITRILTQSPISGIAPFIVLFDGSQSTDPDGGGLTYHWDFGDSESSSEARPSHEFKLTGSYTVILTVNDSMGGSASAQVNITANEPFVPADPAQTVPPIVSGGTFTDQINFLYQGENAIQFNIAAGAIDPTLASVVRGRIFDSDGNPLSGVKVAALGKSEFGHTFSRADGFYDLVINGGEFEIVEYSRDGFLPAQRKLDTKLQNYSVIDDVYLVRLDPKVARVDLANTQDPIFVKGSQITDSDGVRTGALLIRSGTSASLTTPEGSVKQISDFHMRITEYTVGPNGPKRMPAELPKYSAYTYAMEVSVDEAIAAGFDSIHFSKPVVYYVDNFLNFPSGVVVPFGLYNRGKGIWEPQEDGISFRIVSKSGNKAVLDIGDIQQQILGIDDEELIQLANQYEIGASLWRVKTDHFSTGDLNLPPPDDEAIRTPLVKINESALKKSDF